MSPGQPHPTGRIVITGGSGFLGVNLARYLGELGCQVYIATAPNPVSHAEFARELRKALGVPFGLPACAWMVRIAAPLLMRTEPELVLYGRYCVSKRLADEGFEFEYADIASALADLCAK